MAKKVIGKRPVRIFPHELPEHRVAWLTHQEKLMGRDKPILGDHELEQIHRTLIDSYNRRLRIHITVFDPITDKVYEGIVSTIYTYLREFKLVWGKGVYKFFDIEKIIFIRL